MQRSFSVPILGAALFIGAPVIPGGRLVAEKAPDPAHGPAWHAPRHPPRAGPLPVTGVQNRRITADGDFRPDRGGLAQDPASFVYSVLAWTSTGTSGSASFQSARKSWYARRLFAESPAVAAARPSPSCAKG
jgi:hypothetical protein